MKNNQLYPYDRYFFNTMDSLLKDNDLISYYQRIKDFLIKIINSKVYEEAIKILFPNYFIYLLGDHIKDIEMYMNKRLKFYPYQDLGNSGLTDKFSLYSYIPILTFKIFCDHSFLYKCYYPLKISAIIENTIHEINHINQEMIFFKGNNKELFKTPKREKFKSKEEGENLEEILFGEKIEKLRILESLYILNEENYKQNLNDFRNNFKTLYNDSVKYDDKVKFLKINQKNGIFHDICFNIEEYKEEEIKKLELSGIYTKRQKLINIDDIAVYIPKRNCFMGGGL